MSPAGVRRFVSTPWISAAPFRARRRQTQRPSVSRSSSSWRIAVHFYRVPSASVRGSLPPISCLRHPSQSSAQKLKAGRRGNSGPSFNTPVVTTDIGDLPYTMDGDVKVFHLIAQVVKQQIAPDKIIDAWGSTAPRPVRRFR